MVVANPVKPEADDYSVSEKDAGEIYSEIVGEETAIIPVEYMDVADGSKRDANEVVSIEQAAHDLTAWRESQGDGRAASVSKDFANEIDQQRAEAAKEGEDLESRGITPEKPAEVESAEATPPDPALAHLDPEVQKALSNPTVRTALEAEFGRAEQAHAQYSQTLQAAQTIAQATLATLAPELAEIHPAQWETALQIMAQTDPARAQAIATTLDKAQRIQIASQQQAAQQQHAMRQQVDAYTAAQKAEFDKIMPMSQAEAQAAASSIVEYLGELGVSSADLSAALEQHPILRSAAFQKMAVDAAKYRSMMANARNLPRRSAPKVNAPGVSRDRESPAADIARQFATATSAKSQMDLAAQLLTARRSSR